MKGPKRRLFWRVYLNSLLLILAVVVSVTVTVYFTQPEASLYPHSLRLHEVLAIQLSQSLDDPNELQSLLGPLTDTLGRDAAIYKREGELLAAAGAMPPKALSEEKLENLGSWHPLKQDDGQWVYTVPLGDGNAYLLLKGRDRCFLLAPGVVLLAVALFSWPLARNFAKPLERLTATSRNLASGDLSARSGITRKDEVGVLAHSLDEMAGQLEERIRNEKELFANISHEIRTPLTRLRFAIELCEDDSDDAAQVIEYLQGMGNDLAELELLVNNVLISGRLDALASGSGAMPLQLQHVELKDFFACLADRFTRHHPERTLEMKVADQIPNSRLDPVLINRVCDNLLENAAKYSAAGSKITLKAEIEDNRLKVEIIDAGEGVEEQDIPRLFDPFFRGDRSRSRQTGGTGLGLTLCKRIVEAHDGKISAQLNANQGMIFQFEVPITDSLPDS